MHSKVEESDLPSDCRQKVSFSQFSMFQTCNRKYKYAYVDGLRTYENTIHTVFGTAMHEAIQAYVSLLYTKGAHEADTLDLYQIMFDKMKILVDECNKTTVILSKEEVQEFLNDGKQIIDWITLPVNRTNYFPSRVYELIGIEVPLEIELKNNLKYVGFLDIVLKDKKTGNIKILDLKTSTKGWSKWVEKDTAKTDQLILYKKFYSELHNVPLDNIDVEFIILKRQLYEGVQFKQSRASVFTPPNGSSSIRKTQNRFNAFLDNCFNTAGEYITNGKNYPKTCGKHCEWCEFRPVYCNGKPDK